MPEPIKIRIDTSYDGRGAKEAIEDKEKLEGKGKSSLATPPPNINAPQPSSKQETTAATREAARRNRALISDAEEDLARAKATGASPSTISEMESQLREQKLKARFMREQGLPEEAALEKAQKLVGLQNEAKARREALKQESAEGKAATAEKVKAEKAAFAEKRNEEKKAQAEQKSADAARHAEEKKAKREETEEEKKQRAMNKARVGFIQHVAGTATGVAGQSADLGGVGSLGNGLMQLGSKGGPIGIIAAVVATAAVATIAAKQERDHQERLRALSDKSARALDDRQFQREESFEGSASGSREHLESLKTEAIQLQGAKEEMTEKLKKKWYNPGTWDISGENARQRGELDDKIARNKENQVRATEDQARFAKLTTQHEIAREKKAAAGDMVGARGEEDYLTAYNYYRHLKDQLGEGHDDEVEAGTQAHMSNINRQRAGDFSRLVSARDGVNDTMRVAGAAHEFRAESDAKAAEAIHGLRTDLNNNHNAAMTKATRKDFTK